MNEETHVILKYRRLKDSWACENCDTENEMSNHACMLCGLARSSGAQLIRAWSEQDEIAERMTYVRPPARPAARAPLYTKPSTPYAPTGKVFRDEGTYTPPEGGSNVAGIILAAILGSIILIGIVALIAMGSS